jgi:antirestriction protein ArdC
MAATNSLYTEQQHMDKPALRDFRQEVTDNIVRMLERGVAPWQKPWEPGASSLGMPFNPTSERAYRGGNAIHLMATGLQRGYEDPRWMTYKQAADNGWQVSRGEKGTQIEYWEVNQASDKTQPSGPQWERRCSQWQQLRCREIAADSPRVYGLQRPTDRAYSAPHARATNNL